MDLDYLLELSIAFHDFEVSKSVGRNEEEGSREKEFEVLLSKKTLRELLSTLEQRTERPSALLAGLILDNVIDADIFTSQGIDDTHTTDPTTLISLKRAKNQLARSLGFANYFDLYLFIRGYKRADVLELANQTLLATRVMYTEAFNKFLQNLQVSRQEFEAQHKAFLDKNESNFPFEKLVPALWAQLDSLFGDWAKGKVEIKSVSEEIIAFACTLLSQNRSVVSFSEIGGYEQYKAAFHGLGHSLFALLNQAEKWYALPTDIAWTESLAFLFQSIPADQEWALQHGIQIEKSFSSQTAFYEQYFARLYAARVLFEDWYYHNDADSDAIKSMYSQLIHDNIFIIEDDGFVVDFRPLCVEFLHGFCMFNALRPKIGSWLKGETGELLRSIYKDANARLCQVEQLGRLD